MEPKHNLLQMKLIELKQVIFDLQAINPKTEFDITEYAELMENMGLQKYAAEMALFKACKIIYHKNPVLANQLWEELLETSDDLVQQIYNNVPIND
jgi:hypothetical protein